jgi:uncharacterized membrane protein YeaQ/YmgE (transglycosylase-associated protein family)
MINIIVWLILGAILGGIVSLIVKARGRARGRGGLLLNVGVGIAGAFVAGWFISPLLNIAVMTNDEFNFPALIVAAVGSLIFLAIVNFARRGKVE